MSEKKKQQSGCKPKPKPKLALSPVKPHTKCDHSLAEEKDRFKVCARCAGDATLSHADCCPSLPFLIATRQRKPKPAAGNTLCWNSAKDYVVIPKGHTSWALASRGPLAGYEKLFADRFAAFWGGVPKKILDEIWPEEEPTSSPETPLSAETSLGYNTQRTAEEKKAKKQVRFDKKKQIKLDKKKWECPSSTPGCTHIMPCKFCNRFEESAEADLDEQDSEFADDEKARPKRKRDDEDSDSEIEVISRKDPPVKVKTEPTDKPGKGKGKGPSKRPKFATGALRTMEKARENLPDNIMIICDEGSDSSEPLFYVMLTKDEIDAKDLLQLESLREDREGAATNPDACSHLAHNLFGFKNIEDFRDDLEATFNEDPDADTEKEMAKLPPKGKWFDPECFTAPGCPTSNPSTLDHEFRGGLRVYHFARFYEYWNKLAEPYFELSDASIDFNSIFGDDE